MMPLAFLTGIYGTNFDGFFPEVNTHKGCRADGSRGTGAPGGGGGGGGDPGGGGGKRGDKKGKKTNGGKLAALPVAVCAQCVQVDHL